MKINPIFRKALSTSGGYSSTFVFESKEKRKEFVMSEIPKLREKHGYIEYTLSDLHGLKIGDYCYVIGGSYEVFQIKGIKKYENNRYGFILDNGFIEPVHKCYTDKRLSELQPHTSKNKRIEVISQVKFNNETAPVILEQYSAISLLLVEEAIDGKAKAFDEWLADAPLDKKFKITIEEL